MSTIYEDHERLCAATEDHERNVKAYRQRLDNECEALPWSWRWAAVTPDIVTVEGEATVSLSRCGTIVVSGDHKRAAILSADLLEAMRWELRRAQLARPELTDEVEP